MNLSILLALLHPFCVYFMNKMNEKCSSKTFFAECQAYSRILSKNTHWARKNFAKARKKEKKIETKVKQKLSCLILRNKKNLLERYVRGIKWLIKRIIPLKNETWNEVTILSILHSLYIHFTFILLPVFFHLTFILFSFDTHFTFILLSFFIHFTHEADEKQTQNG